MADTPEEEHQMDADAADYHAHMREQIEIQRIKSDQALTRSLAIGQNVATNGRWFSALIVAANCAGGDYRMAALAAVPVGLAAIGDQLPAGWLRAAYTIGIYAMAAVIALISIINLG